MKAMQTALWMEVLKVRKSAVFKISLYFFLFMGIMMGMLMYLTLHPEVASRSSTLDLKTSFLGGSSWMAFFSLLKQLALTIGVIGSGIITSWTFGREFGDRVIKDLLALPVSRSTIVLSKLIVLFFWSILLMAVTLIAALVTGALIHLPGWSEAELLPFLKAYAGCAILNTLLITPVAFVASAGRGYMLPISFVILIMIMTQLLFVGIPGLSVWFPWALPALWAGIAGPLAPHARLISWLLYGGVILGGTLGTLLWWRYGDQK
jgi:ABC-2 type transport system permease protein